MDYHRLVSESFVPFQPSTKRFLPHVQYIEVPPHARVDKFIYCYWQLKTTTPLTHEFTYRVVSDGCIDIFFNVKKPSENFVMGLATKFVNFPLGLEFNYMGIRFFPAVFPTLFKVNASSLTNHFIPLDDLFPDVSDFISSRIKSSNALSDVASLFDNYFIDFIKRVSSELDARFYDAFIKVLESKGCAEIKDLAVGLSLRQLRRLFNYYIGTSPKTFSKIVRFQHVLAAKPSRQSLRRDKLFYDLGYFDQAHFIRDFKAFYGLTPGKAME